VRIIELARNMIRLSGQADGDIPIEVIGPRPGEKLREELFNEGESPVPTDADRIMKADRSPLDPDWVEGVIERVEQLIMQGDETYLAQHVAELASTVHAGAGDDLSALAK
jgi:O-antigen biosynthesis protein WbqV